MDGVREFPIEPEDVYRSFTCLPGTYREEDESFFWKPVDAEFAPGAPNVKGAELIISEPIGVAIETAGPFWSSSVPLQHAAYIEPQTSFSSFAPPHEILNRVCVWLESARVAFEPQVEKSKLKGRVVAASAFCVFVFRAYGSAAAVHMKGNVFELQRRNGCVLLFAELFQQLVAFLGSSVVELNPLPWRSLPPPVNSELGDFPPPLTLGGLGSALTLQEEDATALLRMLDSPLQDVQLEGLRVLATAVTECTLTLKLVCELVAARVGMAQWMTKLDDLRRQEDGDLACSAETLLTSEIGRAHV